MTCADRNCQEGHVTCISGHGHFTQADGVLCDSQWHQSQDDLASLRDQLAAARANLTDQEIADAANRDVSGAGSQTLGTPMFAFQWGFVRGVIFATNRKKWEAGVPPPPADKGEK